MSVAEIIEQIIKLPPQEQGEIIDFVRHLPNAETIEAINEPTEGMDRYKNMNEVTSVLKALVNDA